MKAESPYVEVTIGKEVLTVEGFAVDAKTTNAQWTESEWFEVWLRLAREHQEPNQLVAD